MSEMLHDEETSRNLHDMFLTVDQVANAHERSAMLAKMLFTTEEEQIAEVLTLVRRIISSGWDREWASNEEGNQVEEWRDDAINFNLIAAVLKAGYILEDAVDVVIHSKAADLIFAEVHEHAGSQEVNIHDWQTAPGRTKKDVLYIVDKALKKMKAGLDGC